MNIFACILSTLLITSSADRVKRQEIIFGPPPEEKTDCTTTEGVNGLCKRLFECTPIYSVLISGTASSAFLTHLRSNICRFQNNVPIICCPQESTSQEPPDRVLLTTVSNTEPATTSTTERTTQPVTQPSTEPPNSSSLPIEETTTVPKGFDLLPSPCGNSTNTLTRIVGGRPAKQGAWPWLAALGYRDFRGKLDFLCGGALITKQHILTAAHCIHGRNDLALIRLGEHDLSLEDEVRHEDYRIARRIQHENYSSSTFVNDIAILVLETPVQFSDSIYPGCLPRGSFYEQNSLAGRQAFVAGWGSIAYNNVSSPQLLEAQIPIVTNEDCQEGYAVFRTVVDRKRLCAGIGGSDACQGDSGGPLNVYNTISDTFDIVGVVSVGFRCAEEEYPGIYTRVTEYMDWIERNLD